MPDIADHIFLSETLRLTEHALDLDDIWSTWVFKPELSDSDRRKMVATGTEMRSLLVDIVGRIDRVARITAELATPHGALASSAESLARDFVEAPHIPEIALPAVLLERIFQRSHAALPDLLQALPDEMQMLTEKVNRLERDEDLEEGDFSVRTRNLLRAVVLVATMGVAVLFGPVAGGAAVAAHVAWRAFNIACAAAGVGSLF